VNDVFSRPVGRGAEVKPQAAPVLAYLGAATVSGLVSGTLLGALGLTVAAVAPGGRTLVAVVAVGLVSASVLLEAAGRVRPLPQSPHQVPRRWVMWPQPAKTALAFGAIIGAGALTRLEHAVAWSVAALVLLAPSLPAAALVGALYGAARGGALFVTWVGDCLLGRRIGWERLIHQGRRVGLALAASAATAAAFVIYTL
jgi:hypothetical protein